MTTIRKFCLNDLLLFAPVNLDHRTETGSMYHYLTLFCKWSNYCHVAVAPGNRIVGYIIGVTRKEPEEHEGELGQTVTVSVAPNYRRLKIATRFMQMLEKQLMEGRLLYPRDVHYCVYLYVGVRNIPAIIMFGKLEYRISQTLPKFFLDSSEETAYKMRREIDADKVLRRRSVVQPSGTCSYVNLPPIVEEE